MDEETNAGATTEITRVPRGIGCTLVFLDGLFYLFMLLTLAALLALLFSLTFSRHGEGMTFLAITWSLVVLAVFQLLLAMTIAAAWFSQLIRLQDGVSATSRWSAHPARIFLKPLLLTNEIFAVGNLIVSLWIKFFGSSSTTWGWMFFWIMTWLVSISARRWLDRTIPD